MVSLSNHVAISLRLSTRRGTIIATATRLPPSYQVRGRNDRLKWVRVSVVRAILAAVLLTAASLACSVAVTPDSPLLPAATDLPTYAVAPTHAPLPIYAAEPTYAPQPTYDAGASVTPLPAATALPTYAARPALTPHIPGGWRLIRLADNLDDPQGYCIDVPGFGDNLRLDAPLQAHTCKPGSDDQLFALPTAAIHSIELKDLMLCITAEESQPGASLALGTCGGQPNQDFAPVLDHDQDRLALRVETDTSISWDLCIGVSAGAGEPAGGQNHLRRDLLLYACDETDPALITWEFPDQ